jgi:hypothetical protein
VSNINTGDSCVDEVLYQLQHQQGQTSDTTNSGRCSDLLGEIISWQDPQILIKAVGNIPVPLAQILMIKHYCLIHQLGS